MPKVINISLDLWNCGRTNLTGWPVGMVSRLRTLIPTDGPAYNLYSGPRPIEGFINIDIRPECKPDLVADCHHLPVETGTAGLVIADPPYEQYNARRLYGTDHIRLYPALEEMSRITRPGGTYAILYPFRVATLSGDTLSRVVVVLCSSPHVRPRVLTICIRGMMPGRASHQFDPVYTDEDHTGVPTSQETA